MKEVKAVKALKNDEDSAKLNTEIINLKKILQFKVQKYGDFSHPEVISVSKKLDQKIFTWMSKLYSRDREKEKI